MARHTAAMHLEFTGEAIEWRGPAPYLFVPVPPEPSADIKAVASRASYGWGCISVRARIGGTDTKTSLFPKDGTYLVPIKLAVQRAEGVSVGDEVRVRIEIDGVTDAPIPT